jgi:hypothetical protein
MTQLLPVENLMTIKASIFRDFGGDGRVMAIKRKASFNPKSFLAKVSEGRSIAMYPSDQIVFSQGDLQIRSATSKKAR